MESHINSKDAEALFRQKKSIRFNFNANTEHRIKHFAQINKESCKLATTKCKDGRDVNKDNQQTHSKTSNTPSTMTSEDSLDKQLVVESQLRKAAVMANKKCHEGNFRCRAAFKSVGALGPNLIWAP